ncbi:hypothetical protein [Williamsia sp. CHRR-6]|uniref:hypothetical protein n=1 Tax=Williamsia sp. CHRR-6 TaxID=2835871 RepID=UPI001BDA6D3A|nr:hypothetical protein [Williamsia sp. CHRR-6]MBT0567606.1 hypothetical protein [Williamsia sp. CHRR-6]
MPRLDDLRVARALHRVTGLAAPVLAALAHDDGPLAAGRLAIVGSAIGAPGSPAWQSADEAARADWWVDRMGAVTTVIVAYPGVFGAVADRLPVQDLLGFTQQAFVLCAVAQAYGVDDRHTQTDLLAAVLCNRNLHSATLLAESEPEVSLVKPGDSPIVVAVKPDRDEEPITDEDRRVPRSAREVARRMWKAAKVLRSISSELAQRPSPGRVSKVFSKLPVVGAAADYVGERKALRQAADEGTRWLIEHRGS